MLSQNFHKLRSDVKYFMYYTSSAWSHKLPDIISIPNNAEEQYRLFLEFTAEWNSFNAVVVLRQLEVGSRATLSLKWSLDPLSPRTAVTCSSAFCITKSLANSKVLAGQTRQVDKDISENSSKHYLLLFPALSHCSDWLSEEAVLKNNHYQPPYLHLKF